MSPRERFENFRLLGSERLFRNTASVPQSEVDTRAFGGLKKDFQTAANDQDRLEMRLLFAKLKLLLGVSNLSELQELKRNPQWKEATRKRITESLSTAHGVPETPEAREAFLQRSVAEANNVLRLFDHPENGLFRQYRSRLSQINEVECISDPLDLMLMAFSPTVDPRSRFEARRKLVLMEAAMRSISATEPLDEDMDRFLHFLNTHVWKGMTGETRLVELISEHRITDYACEAVFPLEKNPEQKVRLSNYRRYNAFEMRPFALRGTNEGLTLVEHRKKDIPSLIIKMLRKDTKDPLKVDDYIGLKLVFLEKKHIYHFLETMVAAAQKAGSSVEFQELYDTIQNEDAFRVTNPGSSSALEIVKTHLQLFGMRVELQMHTVRTYLDSRYHDEAGFETYSVRRLFDSGVAGALYPPDMYGLDVNQLKDALLRDRQASVRSSGVDFPPERFPEQKQTVRYTESDLMADTVRIVEQLPEIPDVIMAISAGGMQLASVLKDIYSNAAIMAVDKHSIETIPSIPKSKNVLIVDDIGRDYFYAQQALLKNPHARIAVLVSKGAFSNAPLPVEMHDRVHVGRSVKTSEWVSFFWNPAEFEKGYVKLHGVLLPVYRNDSGLHILAQEMQEGYLKLIGGMKEPGDASLEETVRREMGEEMQRSLVKDKELQSLGDSRFEFVDPQRKFPQIGFVRAFALEMDTPELPLPAEQEIHRYVWVTPEEFIERGKWESYKTAMRQWSEKLRQEKTRQ